MVVDGNCPSEDFLQTKPLESYFEVQYQIERLFNIKVQPNHTMHDNNFFVNDYRIKVYERYLKKFNFEMNKPKYIPYYGWIIIPESLYNERSLVHETLHCFSNLLNLKFIETKYWIRDHKKAINRVFLEGITEFLTGCILFEFYPNCYQFFKDYRSNIHLGYQYEDETNFWYAFVQVFGIDILLEIYFEREVTFEAFEDVHNSVIEVIKRKYCDFEIENSNHFEDWQSGLSSVSKKFEKRYLEIDKELDFSIFPFL